MKWIDVKDELHNIMIKNIINNEHFQNYRKNELLEYLNHFNNSKKIKDNNLEIKQNDFDSDIYPKDINSIFKKEWKTLPTIHKIIKIKEFCNRICNSNQRKLDMENKLIQVLKNKKLDNNLIKYDIQNCKIILIKNLDSILNI